MTTTATAATMTITVLLVPVLVVVESPPEDAEEEFPAEEPGSGAGGEGTHRALQLARAATSHAVDR